MSLRKSAGNMYPWVTHMHCHVGGRCPHECGYCYVQAMERRYQSGRYAGPLRLIEDEFAVNYGSGRTIFLEHMNDLFAEGVPDEWIRRILGHAARFPENIYVSQSKNPRRMAAYCMPPHVMLGTTIETTEPTSGIAPQPFDRAHAMAQLRLERPEAVLFVTLEPLQQFNLREMVSWLRSIRPTFVNVGADSKGHGLNEPTGDEVADLLAELQKAGVEVRQKRNLGRLLGSNR